MLIAGFDLATKTGFAVGRPGAIPRSGVARLKKPDQDLEVAPSNLGCFVRDQIFALELPDLIVYEAALPFFAEHDDGRRRSHASLVLPPMLTGALLCIAGQFGVPCVRYQANTIRKIFLGRASHGDRKSTKDAVIRQARVEKLIPADCRDDNRADAVATWMVGCLKHAAHRPAELVLFGERAA